MKFSVIIPVYNTEKHLSQCIESVLAQSYKDFEIILVDDGSTDSSKGICDSFANENENVRVIHQTNGGASKARNTGLDNAKGDYILFVDSDDYWLDNNALKQLSVYDEDIIIFGCTDFNVKTGKQTVSRGEYDKSVFATNDENQIKHYLLSEKKLPGGPTVFAIKRLTINNNNLRFKEGIQAEDYDWVLGCVMNSNTFSAIDNPFYLYRRAQNNSVTANSGIKIIEGSIYTIEKWKGYANALENEVLKKDLMNYLAHIYSTAIIVAGNTDKNGRTQAVKSLKPYKSILRCAYWKQTVLVNLFVKLFGVRFASYYINKIYRIVRR